MDLSEKVFKVDNNKIPAGDNFVESMLLEGILQEIITKELGHANAKMADTSAKTEDKPRPTFVIATSLVGTLGPSRYFRSYDCTGYSANECYIYKHEQEMRHTFFPPIYRCTVSWQFHNDGGLRHNNPSEVVLRGARGYGQHSKDFCLQVWLRTTRERRL